jgi:hypothetical protein
VTVHIIASGSGLTACCRVVPTELPADDQISTNSDRRTCSGPPPPRHQALADTQPHTDGSPGGHWFVACLCGWEKSGTYARTNEIAEAVALRLANAHGTNHENEHNAKQEA